MGLFDDFSGNFASLLNLNQPNTTVNNSYAGQMQQLLQQYAQQQQKTPQAPTMPAQPVQPAAPLAPTTPMQPIQSPVASQPAASPATGTYSPPSGTPQGLTGAMNSMQDMNPQSLQAVLTVLANPAYRKLTGQQ